MSCETPNEGNNSVKRCLFSVFSDFFRLEFLRKLVKRGFLELSLTCLLDWFHFSLPPRKRDWQLSHRHFQFSSPWNRIDRCARNGWMNLRHDRHSLDAWRNLPKVYCPSFPATIWIFDGLFKQVFRFRPQICSVPIALDFSLPLSWNSRWRKSWRTTWK